MISVLISSESRYKINRKKIRQAVENLLLLNKIDDIEVSILFVGSRKIKDLNNDYRKINEPTDVLSFPQESSRDPDGFLRLGDVVVSYPQAVDESIKENKMVDDKINELVEHGMKHLLGEHHPE